MKKYLTQNIDNLEEKAGFKREDLVQAHGANFGARCSKCKKEANRSEMEASIKKGEVYSC